MRCVFVLHAPRDPHGAVYADTRRRAVALRDRGHDVEIVTPGDLPGTAGLAPRWLPFVYPVRVVRRVLSEPAPADVAVFHSYTGWFLRLVRALWPPARRLRMVTQFHGLEPIHYRAIRDEHRRMGRPLPLRTRLLQGIVVPAMARMGCRASDRVVCLNRAEERFLTTRRWVRPDRLVRLANAVEPDLFTAAVHRPQVRRLLFLGQWFPGKGIRYLARAFDRLAAERPELELCCLGTRISEDTVRQDFPAAVRHRVRVVPAIERSGVAAELAAADLFVFPSLAEGFSVALLEAMAAGLPIVATRVGAAPDLLADGESALLVEPADVGALTDAIERLLDDAPLRRRLAAGARKRAATHTWDRRAADYVKLIESLET